MFFKKSKKIEIEVSTNTSKYFSQLDTLLQAVSFTDGCFAGSFMYFRGPYFELIDKEMNGMSYEERIHYAEKERTTHLQTLAALSRVLKIEIFDSYLSKMYSDAEQEKIKEEIKQFPIRIPIEPISKKDTKE